MNNLPQSGQVSNSFIKDLLALNALLGIVWGGMSNKWQELSNTCLDLAGQLSN
jgi:hypothetical protein